MSMIGEGSEHLRVPEVDDTPIHGQEGASLTEYLQEAQAASEGYLILAQLDVAVATGRSVILRRGGEIVGVFYPMNLAELVRRRLEKDPELQATIEGAIERHEGSLPTPDVVLGDQTMED